MKKSKSPHSLIELKDKILPHLLKHKSKYLLSVLFLILLVVVSNNLVSENPLLKGSESYYYLQGAENINYNFLTALISLLPPSILFLLPPLIALLSILIIFKLADQFKLSQEFSFFLGLFLILSPSFIFSIISISAYALFFFLTLAGFLLLLNQKDKLKIFSLIPFIAATFIDTFSTSLLLFLLITYSLINTKKTKNKISIVATIITITLLIFNKFILKIPLLIGPFHLQNLALDLVSDLGGLSGVGFFLLLLSIIGLGIAWKKNNYYVAYLLLIPLTIAYIFNTQIIFYLAILIIFFATLGFIKIFKYHWSLITLKKITIFLLLLGIIFSTLTYIERISDYHPLKEDQDALTWIKDNTLKETIIFSSPENSYYIKYFSKREPFNHPLKQNKKKKITQQILKSDYITELFPLLENNNLSIIYISEDMKKSLPSDQKFLFLLKNERFKLIHSSGNSEVWSFK